MLSIRVSALIAMALSIAMADAAYARSFSYTVIAAGSLLSGLNSRSLSEDGYVGFFRSEAGSLIISKGNGGPVISISAVPSIYGNTSINDLGAVAFACCDGDLVRVGDGIGIQTLFSAPFSSVSSALIANDGSVTFRGRVAPGGSEQDRILTVLSGTVTERYGGQPTNFSINDHGDLVVHESAAILRVSGGLQFVVADTSGVFSGFGGAPAMNNDQTVALLAGLDSGGEGIFSVDVAGNVKAVADSTGGISTFGGGPAINNLGDVAFVAHLEVGGDGIFVGPDLVNDKVIEIGDTLLGSSVSALGFGVAINDAGQIAFRAELQDGRFVIVRADPIAVPEPATLALLGLGLAGLGVARRRKAAYFKPMTV